MKKFRLRPEQTLVAGFAGLIAVGTLLLMLPASNRGEPLGLIDALFTATSATCVTGLVVVDTGTQFTIWGQLVILALIQLGGLGIMTFSTLFLYLLSGHLSLGSRDMLRDTLGKNPHGRGVKPLLKTVFLATILAETIGALVLAAAFSRSMPLPEALYYGVFHAVSAFCNAGFALFPDSLMAWRTDPLINLTTMALIIAGGLGFVVVYELHNQRSLRWRTMSLNARIVLATTFSLIVAGALLFLVLEWRNGLRGMSLLQAVQSAFFQSVTTRTAGFNTVDLSILSNPTLFAFLILMFIGASPASCGGGIKTTTFAIILAHIRAMFYTQDDTNIFSRRVPDAAVSRAISITFFAMIVILLGTSLLLVTELAGMSHQASRGQFLELLFEVTSAFATVGLSMGKTATLTDAGKLIILALMFIGRLGPLTVAMAIGKREKLRYRYVQEDVLVG